MKLNIVDEHDDEIFDFRDFYNHKYDDESI